MNMLYRKSVFIRLIVLTILTSFLTQDVLLASREISSQNNSLSANSPFDTDPRNNGIRDEMVGMMRQKAESQGGGRAQKPTLDEIKAWPSRRIKEAEKELVARFGYKGWNLVLAHALSREIGGFTVPEFEIIEIDGLWEPFYEANRDAIDKIIKINQVKEAFKKALEDVYREYKTSEERRVEFRRRFDGELAYLKVLFGVNNMDEFEDKLGKDPIAYAFSSSIPDFPVSRVTIQLLFMMEEEIAEKLDFNYIAPVLKKYREFISKRQSIYCRTSATDEDTSQSAKAGKYRSGSMLWEGQDTGIERLLGRIIISDLYALRSRDVSCAFVLQDTLSGDDLEGGVVFSELGGNSVVELGYSKKNPLIAATKGDKSIIIKIANGEVREVLYNNVREDDEGLNHLVVTKVGSEHKITIEKKVLERIVSIAKDIEKRLGYAVDIELGVKGKEIFIVQIRPVTGNSVQPLPEFRREDIIAEFPVSINEGIAKGIKVVFIEGFVTPYDIQRIIGYDERVLFCIEGRISPDMMPRFIFGDKIFWAGKSICKIAHSAINERQEGIDVIMGYFGNMGELRNRFGPMRELNIRGKTAFISEQTFDIYSNGDRAVLVRAEAKPIKLNHEMFRQWIERGKFKAKYRFEWRIDYLSIAITQQGEVISLIYDKNKNEWHIGLNGIGIFYVRANGEIKFIDFEDYARVNSFIEAIENAIKNPKETRKRIADFYIKQREQLEATRARDRKMVEKKGCIPGLPMLLIQDESALASIDDDKLPMHLFGGLYTTVDRGTFSLIYEPVLNEILRRRGYLGILENCLRYADETIVALTKNDLWQTCINVLDSAIERAGSIEQRTAITRFKSSYLSNIGKTKDYAKIAVDILLSTIRAKAQACKDLDEELVLAIDTDIGNLGMFALELFGALNKLQDALAREGLDNVRIFIGNGEEIEAQIGEYLARKGDKKDFVVSAVVKSGNIEKKGLFKGIKEKVHITAVDDAYLENSDNDRLNYIPILSILELSIKKAMGTPVVDIKREYSSLPNIQEIFERDGMLIIYLLPKSNPIPINELKERYQNEAILLTSA